MPAHPIGIFIAGSMIIAGTGFAFKKFVYDPHLAPFLEELALRYLNSRERESDQIPVPVSISSGLDADGERTPRRRRQPDTWDGYVYDEVPHRYSDTTLPGSPRGSLPSDRSKKEKQMNSKRRSSSPAMVEEEITGLTSSLSLSTGEVRRRHHEVGSGKALQLLVDDVISPTISKPRAFPLYDPPAEKSSPKENLLHLPTIPHHPVPPPSIKSDALQAADNMMDSTLTLESTCIHSPRSSSNMASSLDFSIIEQTRAIQQHDLDNSMMASTTISSSTPSYRPQSSASNPWSTISLPRDTDDVHPTTITPSTMSPYTVTSSLPPSPTGSYAHMSPPYNVPDLPTNDSFHIQPMSLSQQGSRPMTEDSWTDGDVASSEFRG